jgi:hypothetical protein
MTSKKTIKKRAIWGLPWIIGRTLLMRKTVKLNFRPL